MNDLDIGVIVRIGTNFYKGDRFRLTGIKKVDRIKMTD